MQVLSQLTNHIDASILYWSNQVESTPQTTTPIKTKLQQVAIGLHYQPASPYK